MINIDKEDLINRFVRYVQIDTQSDPESEVHPTTEKQKELSSLLCRELLEMGIQDATTMSLAMCMQPFLPTPTRKIFLQFVFVRMWTLRRTAAVPDVKPIIHRNYNGLDIVLPDDNSQVLRVIDSPYLKTLIGSDIITASGKTLLGADDKSGVAVIMQAAKYLMENPSIKHGDIKIVFTPDEEVGKGTAKIDMQKVGAQFGYTLDGGEAGSLEDETFSADGATITIHGVIAHPGYAKGVLVNAIKIAGEILDALPKNEWSPETTEGKLGFVHPVSVNGIAEKATIRFIVRDFTREGLQLHHERLKKLAESIVARHFGASMIYEEQEQYRNMKEILDLHPQVAAYAEMAIERSGLKVKKESIRGGTDGSKLSYMGLPCPNIFTGMQNIHSKLEWIGVNDMAKATETIVHLCQISGSPRF